MAQHKTLYRLPLCPRQFAQSSKLRLHQRTHERASSLALTLSTIGDAQEQRSRGYRHDLAHIPETVNDMYNEAMKRLPAGVAVPTRHQCTVCAAFFSTSSNLKAHASTHLDQRNFQCSVCERTFKSGRDLRRHEPIHKTVKDIVCPLCAKAFNKRTYLNVHMLTVHRGIRRHKCNECGKVFGNRSNLICHLRTHTGEKPFQCSFCPWKFNQSSGLARHLKKHSKNLNQKLNTTSDGGHHYEEDALIPRVSGQLNGVMFDAMQHGIMGDQHHHHRQHQHQQQNKTDFDSFETVDSLISENYPSHVVASSHSSRQVSPSTPFL